jgi:hypothetical protein
MNAYKFGEFLSDLPWGWLALWALAILGAKCEFLIQERNESKVKRHD